MESIGNQHSNSHGLREHLVLAMAAGRLQQRLHDPDNILAAAAADDLIAGLLASGFVVTAPTAIPTAPDGPAERRG